MFSGLDELYSSLHQYQSGWLADSSKSTRMSQWKIYLGFCKEFDRVPLPATTETILLYIAYLAETRCYVTIVNYLSAVWSLHKLNGIPHVDPSSFPITMTLRGVCRTLGDSRRQATPITVYDLRLIFTTLDLLSSEDVAYWFACVLCFHGLLRKSNMVEKGLAVLLSDCELHHWGLLVKINRSKTISFKERVLSIPFNILSGSIFCVHRLFLLLCSLVTYPSPDSQLISFMRNGVWVRVSYSWFTRRLKTSSSELMGSKWSTHSLRRGGASALGKAQFSLLDIKDMGDWSSLAVLQYISKSLEDRIELDRRMCDSLFVTSSN